MSGSATEWDFEFHNLIKQSSSPFSEAVKLFFTREHKIQVITDKWRHRNHTQLHVYGKYESRRNKFFLIQQWKICQTSMVRSVNYRGKYQKMKLQLVYRVCTFWIEFWMNKRLSIQNSIQIVLISFWDEHFTFAQKSQAWFRCLAPQAVNFLASFFWSFCDLEKNAKEIQNL